MCWLIFTSNMRIGRKCSHCDFDHNMAVGARQAGLSNVKTADRQEFSQPALASFYSEWCKEYPVSG